MAALRNSTSAQRRESPELASTQISVPSPTTSPLMALPSPRELELETLLRQRDAKLVELSDEVTQLRQYAASQPGPSTTEAITLPPTTASMLLARVHAAASSMTAAGATSSGTVVAALNQRIKLLQEENDELYDILKQGETGRLKEEARGLRRIVDRLENALKESHQVISTLSTELDKSYEAFAAYRVSNNPRPYSSSPRNSYYMPVPSASTGNNGTAPSAGKHPPTGPRAHKKPRMSDAGAQQPQQRQHVSSSARGGHETGSGREWTGRQPSDGRGASSAKPAGAMKMDYEEDQRARPPSPVRERNRDRERDRDRGRDRGPRERERDRDRDRDRGDRVRDRDSVKSFRRNGNFGGGSNRGSGGRRSDTGGDRTLAERMGL